MSSKVKPVHECQICFDTYETNKIRDLKCWSKDNDHIICKECFDKESNRRKEMGLQHPNECIICRPFQERIQQITIRPINNVTITYDISARSPRDRCPTWHDGIMTIHACYIFIFLYIGLILNWHLYRIIFFFIKEGEYLDESISWNPLNIFCALIVDLCLFAGCSAMFEDDRHNSEYY